MIVRDWSRNQFGGDDVVDEISKALSTGAQNQWSTSPYNSVTSGNGLAGNATGFAS